MASFSVTIPAPCLRNVASKTGYLFKTDEAGKKKTKFFFVLTNKTMFTYKKASDPRPTGCNDVDGAFFINMSKEVPFQFQIKQIGWSQLYFIADSEEEFNGWLNAFSEELKPHGKPVFKPRRNKQQLLEGVNREAEHTGVMQISSKNKNYKKRFCALYKGILYKFKSATDIDHVGFTPLVGYSVAKAPEAKSNHAFKLTCPGLKSYFFIPETEEESNTWQRYLHQAANLEAISLPEAVDENEEIDDAAEADVVRPIVNDGVAISNKEWILEEPEEGMEDVSMEFRCTLEQPPSELDWYRKYFAEQEHTNYIATLRDDSVMVVSLKMEETAAGIKQVRVVVWSKDEIDRYIVPLEDLEAKAAPLLEDVLQVVDEEAYKNRVFFREIPENAMKEIERTLVKVENDEPGCRTKIGVLFAKEGQTTEAEMFGNEHGSDVFDQFLDLLGERVRLLDYKGYSAQLNTRCDKDGPYSVARPGYHGHDIMFHVSTLMHYDPGDPQQVQRKRHIGNDIVVIVFVDGETPYDMGTMLSQYTRVIPVVQATSAAPDEYSFSCGTMIGIPAYGPPASRVFKRNEAFIDLLLTKCLNGQRATCQGREFKTRTRRTRATYLAMMMDDLTKDSPLKKSKLKLAESFQAPKPSLTREFAAKYSVVDVTTIPEPVTGLDSSGDHVVFTTASALFTAPFGGTPRCAKMLQNSPISLRVCAAWGPNGTAFVLTDMAVIAFDMLEVTTSNSAAFQIIPNTKQATGFAVARMGDEDVLCVAIGSSLVVFNAAMRTLQTIVCDGPVALVASLPSLPSIVVVGCLPPEGVEDSVPTTFTVDLSKKGSVRAIYPTLDSDRIGVLIDVLEVSRGMPLLCFEWGGVALKVDVAKLVPEYRVAWSGRPYRLGIVDHFFFACSRSEITFYTAIAGVVIETAPACIPKGPQLLASLGPGRTQGLLCEQKHGGAYSIRRAARVPTPWCHAAPFPLSLDLDKLSQGTPPGSPVLGSPVLGSPVTTSAPGSPVTVAPVVIAAATAPPAAPPPPAEVEVAAVVDMAALVKEARSAALREDLETLERLIVQEGVDVNSVNKNGMTMLALAIERKKGKAAKWLRTNGGVKDISQIATASQGKRIAARPAKATGGAAASSEATSVEAVRKKLVAATMGQDTAALEQLIVTEGHSIETTNKAGLSLLALATERKKSRSAEWLRQHGAKVLEVASKVQGATTREHTYYVAIVSYEAQQDGEVSFKEGERVERVKQAYPDWFDGVLKVQKGRDKTGVFPERYFEERTETVPV